MLADSLCKCLMGWTLMGRKWKDRVRKDFNSCSAPFTVYSVPSITPTVSNAQINLKSFPHVILIDRGMGVAYDILLKPWLLLM